jgi:tubulin--tyrosine ligase
MDKKTSESSADKKDENRKSNSQEKSLENTPKVAHTSKFGNDDTDRQVTTKIEIQPLYKYSIGRGNNGLMVRSLFKHRFWWMIADKGADMERVNFMWT